MMQTAVLTEIDSLEESMMETFHELAGELHLPDLHWEFVHAHDEVIVEGRPQAATDITSCPRWARFLSMQAIGSADDVRGSRWLGNNGPWTLEIIAEVA
jgi:hypothetical protein